MTARELDTGVCIPDAGRIPGCRRRQLRPPLGAASAGHINEQRESATDHCAELHFEYQERVGLPSLCRLAARPQAAPPKTKVLTKALTRRGPARRPRPGEIRVFLAAAGFLSFASFILMDDLPPLGEMFYSAPSSRGRFPPMTWPRTGGAFF